MLAVSVVLGMCKGYVSQCIICIQISGQECLRANNTNSLPPFQDYQDTNFNTDVIPTDVIPHQHQAIILSYRFYCYGNIIEWGVGVCPASSKDNLMYTLDLQVWRPSPMVKTTSCYSLVGNNRFTSVSLNSSVAVVTPLPQDTMHSNLEILLASMFMLRMIVV